MLDAEQKMKLLISDRPWEHEPDNEEWIDATTGYKCTIWRHPTHGQLNGYVAIPKGHKCHGASEETINNQVEVHGGLTYMGTDKETGEFVVGFDTNHHDDFAPKLGRCRVRATKQRNLPHVRVGEGRGVTPRTTVSVFRQGEMK